MSIQDSQVKRQALKRETRREQGLQLRSLYRELGHDRTSVAKFLHVTPRTLFNWESGRSPVPFSTLKLLRLLVRSELPGKEWAGWCFNRGTLWTPEGYGFKAKDFAWLSMTIRRARMFSTLFGERRDLLRQLDQAKAAAAAARDQLATNGLRKQLHVMSAAPRRGDRAARAAGDGSCLVTPPVRLTGESTAHQGDGLVTRPFGATGGTGSAA